MYLQTEVSLIIKLQLRKFLELNYIYRMEFLYAFKTFSFICFPLIFSNKKIFVSYRKKFYFMETILPIRFMFFWMHYSNTVKPRNTGCQVTNNIHLLLADFCYCQYRILKEMTWRDQSLAFVIGGFPLFLGPVQRGLTLHLYVL